MEQFETGAFRQGLRRTIGIIDNHSINLAQLEEMLQEAGHSLRICRSAADFRASRAAEEIDLLLLDWHLPDASGIELTRDLRCFDRNRLAIVFVSDEDREARVVEALEAGADDYLVRPLGRAGFLARLNAVLRRGDQTIDSALSYPPYQLNRIDDTVEIGSRLIRATPKEFDFLAFLFARQGQVCSRAALLTRVWRKRVLLPTRTIDTHASRLKKKYELDGRHGWLLEGVYQQGYRLRPVSLADRNPRTVERRPGPSGFSQTIPATGAA